MAGPSNAFACSAIPSERFVRTAIALGYPAFSSETRQPRRSGRKALTEFVYEERYGVPFGASVTQESCHHNAVMLCSWHYHRGRAVALRVERGAEGLHVSLHCNEARSLVPLEMIQRLSWPDREHLFGKALSLNFSEFIVPDLGVVTSVFKIILFDLILSGDNAVVIGMAARRLSPRSRKRAIVLGGAGAIGLRVFFTGIAALVLDPHRGLPVVGIGGGSLLLWIAYKLLLPQESSDHVTEAETLAEAVRTIILADVVMSLDNILAVGAAAAGHLWLLLFGLALSIPILLVGSNLVAQLLGRVPLLVYAGALILVWTAVEMALKDHLIHEVYAVQMWQILAVALIAALIVVGLAQRQSQQMVSDTVASGAEQPTEAAPSGNDPPASVGASSRAGADVHDHKSAFPQ